MPAKYTLELDETERQMLVMALARLSVERPGWNSTLQRITDKLKGLAMYKDFQRLKANSMILPIHRG